MRRVLSAAVTLALVAVSCTTTPQTQSTPPFHHLQVSAALHSYSLPGLVLPVVSAVQVNADEFFVSDHFDVFHLVRTSSGYSVTRVNRPAVPTWSPVGLAYRDGLLYVATGHDIAVLLVADRSGQALRRITNPAMKGPQNQVVSPDGSITVADAAGGAVLRFRQDGALQWRVPVNDPHGIAESGGFIYATTASGGQITKIDPAGHVVTTTGTTGTSLGRYLYPVGIADDAGRLLVTDAINGRITVVNAALHALTEVGGDGPGVDALNYPSAALPISDGYLIVDTYKNRLLRTDRGWTIQEQIAFGQMVPTGRQRALVYGTDAHPFSYPSLPAIDVAAELGLRPPISFVAAYHSLDHYNHDGTATQLLFGESPSTYYLETWAQRVGTAIVAGSPESDMLMVIDRASGMFTYVKVGFDAWPRGADLLLSDNLHRTLADVIAPALASFAAAQQLLAAGMSRQKAFDTALRGGAHDWAADLATPMARQFLRGGMTKTEASSYFSWALQQPQQQVIELLEVKYLSAS